MHRHDRRLLAAAVVVGLAVVVLVVVLVNRQSNKPPATVASDKFTTIPVNGAKLSAEVVTPKGAHRAPLVVMPAGWGAKAIADRAIATKFAAAGYQVVSYAQRGWGGSTGDVDFAGSKTQRDAIAVISWALAHTPSDPRRVGMFGMSYGAGISLLTAAHDPRVRAVAALDTWADVADSYDPNNTPSTAALLTLLGGPDRVGNFDSTVRSLQKTLATAPVTIGTELRSISPSRSPSSYIKELNKNRPAIMIGNAFEDSLFNPGQLVPFFNALTTPKRLELAAGDHGGPERAALTGGPSASVDDAQAWLDHYLRGVRNSIQSADPVVLRDIRTSVRHTFGSWPAPSTSARVSLGAPGPQTAFGGQQPSWQASLQSGVDSGATSGPFQFVASSDYRVPTVQMSAISTKQALAWTGPTVRSELRLNGAPSVHLSLGSSASTATVFAYLYDVAPNGTGSLLDVTPYTAVGLTPGSSRPVTIGLRPTSWTVPAGDHLALVIDTVDPRFTSPTLAGTTITVSSSSAEPATFTAPQTG